jgi:hypothetical protein
VKAKEVSRAEDGKSRRVEEGGAMRKQRLTRTFNIVLYIRYSSKYMK